MKTQLPAQKQSAPIIPAPPVKDAPLNDRQARWQGTPFSTERFSANRLPQIQAKMRVSQPHDPQEREADETAAKIMNMPEPTHDAGGDGAGDGSHNGDAGSAGGIQRQATGTANGSSSSIIVARSAPAAPVISEVQRSPDGGMLEGREQEEEREEADDTHKQEILRKVGTGASDAPPADSGGADADASGDPSGSAGGEAGADAADAAGPNPDSGSGGDAGAGEGSGGDGSINLSGNGGSAAGGVDEAVESRIRALRGRGQPLHPTEKRFFESRFGRDFSRVRLHTDGQSQDLAKRVNAKAFAVGENIVFGRGYYQPGTRDGRELMAHELTHVVQQGKAPATGARDAGSANKAPAAKTNGAAKTAITTPANAPAIHRQAAEGETVHRAPEDRGPVLDKIRDFADKFAGNIPGYRLMTLVIGLNPITGKKVQRTALNFVRAAVAFIPGGDVLFGRIQQSGVLQQAFNWLSKEFGKLGITWPLIKDLLKRALDRVGDIGILGAIGSFLTGDLFPKVLRIFKEIFGPTLSKLINFVKKVAIKIKEFVFRGFIRLVGGREGPVFRFLNPIVNLLGRIFNDPISFGRNLLGAVGKGFKQFMGNFVKHFKGALFGWMFGTFSKAGIQVPTSFEPAAIFGFVAQLFAVTWTDIRAKIVKRMGPKGNTIMTAVEKSIEVVTILVTKGPQGLYEKIKQDLGSLKETILGAVLTWVRNTIIVKAIVKIASLLNPAGAIVQAILAIYNVVMFFIERFEQIKALVQGIMGALQDIVLGKIGPAANKVEQTMARALTLVISFLARLVGLGNIVKPVQKVIRRIKKRIDKAIDKIIRQITVRARVLWRKFKRKAKKVKDKIVNWWKFRKKIKLENNESHTVFVKGKPPNAEIFVESRRSIFGSFLDRFARNSTAGSSAPGSEDALSPRTQGRLTRLINLARRQYGGILAKLRRTPSGRRIGQSAAKRNQTTLNRLANLARQIMNLRKGNRSIREGDDVVLPFVRVPAFKLALPHRVRVHNSNPLFRHKSYERGTPGQDGVWKRHMNATSYRSNGRSILERKIRENQTTDRIDNRATHTFRSPDGIQTTKKIDHLLTQYRKPTWGRDGSSQNFEVDHIVELQLAGWHASQNINWANRPINMELVQRAKNGESGRKLMRHMERLVQQYRRRSGDSRTTEKIKEENNIRFERAIPGLGINLQPGEYWSREEVINGQHLENLEHIPTRNTTDS